MHGAAMHGAAVQTAATGTGATHADPAHGTAYERRRSQIEAYFDRTAAEAWSRLTSDAPLGRIRASADSLEQ